MFFSVAGVDSSPTLVPVALDVTALPILVISMKIVR